MKKLFKLYGAESSDLVLYLKDDSEENKEMGKLEEIRLRYWTYALDLIHQAHGDHAFSNINPNKYQSISGYFGLNGGSIYCSAGTEKASVGIAIATKDKAKNKMLFDNVFFAKEAIESALCCEIGWDRADNYKASYIYLSLNGVNVQNESDWQQMAKFHAEWSKKFYDVIVPYLAGM